MCKKEVSMEDSWGPELLEAVGSSMDIVFAISFSVTNVPVCVIVLKRNQNDFEVICYKL